jgi:hypothetical protein
LSVKFRTKRFHKIDPRPNEDGRHSSEEGSGEEADFCGVEAALGQAPI